MMYGSLLAKYKLETGVSYIDSLTRLYTHGAFRMILDLQMQEAIHKGTVFSVGFIDVDLFSLYNHAHGPVQADIALKKIAEIIGDSLGENDMAARYYCDTFAVIFNEHETKPVMLVAERIRNNVELAFSRELTVSIGLAVWSPETENIGDILRKAEESLAQAKIKGKNRVHFPESSHSLAKGSIPNVLVVDDEKTNRFVLASQLRPLGYHVIMASSGEETLSIIKRTKVNLILLDVMMPGMDGYEVCRRIKKNPATRLIPIIMITALEDTDSRVLGIQAGADDFLTKPPVREELIARTRSLLTVNMLNQKLTRFENVLYSLANAVEAKDPYTQGHSKRVADMGLAIGRKLNLEDTLLQELHIGGLLHDVGKIGVPEKILNKKAPLTSVERLEIEKHTVLGYTICLPLKENLGSALEVIRHHHERLDGSSYPDGLKGNEVSIESRIIAVSDVYDALTTNRPYREAFSVSDALGILDQEVESGKLDPEVVAILKTLI